MLFLHVVAAVLASWRITELLTQDRVTERFRKWANTYLFSCPRCVSVWAGAWVTLVVVAGARWPWLLWLNWPFAVAWIYMWRVDSVYAKRIAKEGRRFVVEARGPGVNVTRNDFSLQETQEILSRIVTQLVQSRVQPPLSESLPTPPDATFVNGGVKTN